MAKGNLQRNLLIVFCIGLICVLTYQSWGALFPASVNPPTPEVTLQVQTNDGIGEAVFSPTNAYVKVWDKATGIFLGALSEDSTFDGKWASAFTVPVFTTIVLKVGDTSSTYYTTQVERIVGPAAVGVDRISVLDPIDVYPRSATSASDIVGTIMTSGVEVDNSTGIASGETELDFSLTAASGKAWGGIGYWDYETGKEYIGAFLVFDLTTTTARATITGNIWQHFSIGSHEYWIIRLPQIVNDADLANDGTYTFSVTFNNLVAGSAALDIHLGVNAKLEDVLATSFGTNDAGESAAEAWLNIALSS